MVTMPTIPILLVFGPVPSPLSLFIGVAFQRLIALPARSPKVCHIAKQAETPKLISPPRATAAASLSMLSYAAELGV